MELAMELLMKSNYVFYLFLVQTILFFSGCCKSSQPPEPSSKTPVQQVKIVEENEVVAAPEEEVDDAYVPMTFEDKLEDFRKRLEWTSAQDMIFYAEDLFDKAPDTRPTVKMELSFFLAQQYKKKGNKEKATYFSETFWNLRKGFLGGWQFW
jgi:hypothetical protein